MLNHILVRLGIYYATVMALLGGLLRLFPQIQDYISFAAASNGTPK